MADDLEKKTTDEASNGFIQKIRNKIADGLDTWYGKAIAVTGSAMLGYFVANTTFDKDGCIHFGSKAEAAETGDFNNLVPDLSGIEPYREETFFDRGDKLTEKRYRLGDGEVWTYETEKGHVFLLAIDHDRYRPLDYLLFNKDGNGFNVKYDDPNTDVAAPAWAK